MVTVNKTIENLKPGKQYLVTVRPKDADLNLALNPVSAIRFTVPDDATKPADLSDLVIVGNYKSIMISFNPSNEADLRGYNYQVYLPENIALSGSAYVIVDNATPYLSGFSASNVITLDVPQNSETTNNVDSSTGVTTTTTTEKLYFARVQSVDTTGNLSNFTPIVASTATTLIDSAHIIDLTASKITAGTIGAHTITMAGGTSVIKSSTFDGVDVGGGSYANATTGWLINGSGRSYFYDATIAGSIDIGGFDSGSFHVDADGNLWLGSGTLVNAPFKVLKEGDVTANTITAKNLTLTGDTVLSSSDPSKIYLGVGNYNNSDTGFYVDSSSQFSLGDKLTWDGTSLTVKGTLLLPNGDPLPTGLDEDDVEELIYEDGFIGGLTINATKLYYGTGNFNSQDTAFYVAKNITSGQADFSLGDKLSWDGTTLNITGNIVITSGATKELIDDVKNTADDAQADADAAQSAADLAQSDADAAYAYADSAFNTANNKITIGGTGITVDSNGRLTQISGDVIRTGLIASNANVSYINLSNGTFSFGSGSISWNGSTLDVNGTVTAGNGKIGGWDINSSTLSSPDNQTILDPDGYIRVSGNIEATGFVDANDSLRTSGYIEADNINSQGITCNGLTGFGTANRMGLIWNNPDFVGVVDGGNAVMVLGTASDVRFKENITNLESTFIEKLLNEVRIVEYTPKAILANDVPKTKKRTGIIAQEIINVFPDLVVGGYENPENFLSVNYAGFVPYLIKTVQYMSNQIETLEARIATLES